MALPGTTAWAREMRVKLNAAAEAEAAAAERIATREREQREAREKFEQEQQAQRTAHWESERASRRVEFVRNGGTEADFDRDWSALKNRLINDDIEARKRDSRIYRPHL